VKLSRRSFFMLPMLAPLHGLATGTSDEHRFHFDHIMGTSLDLAVWLPRHADSSNIAQRAAGVALAEVQRLSRILSTYDVTSEIRAFEQGGPIRSTELADVLALYRSWEAKTCGVISLRPRGADSPINVDALGKAYIIDRASEAIRRSIPQLDGLLLNVGGDIVVRGRTFDIAVTNPAQAHDNAAALTNLVLRNQAVATSGTYARGAHLIDARTGEAPACTASATVFADDAVTANALATMLCVTDADEGLALVEKTPGAEAIRIAPDGLVLRTSGFARRERFQNVVQTASNWPAGFEVAITLTLIQADPRMDRSYVGFWVEDGAGKLVRTIVLWGNKKQYHNELTGLWKITGGDEALLFKVTRATRAPGNYRVVWNGLDDQGKPVPRGTYRIVVETNRWHGEYAKAVGTLACDSEPASVTLPGSVNYESIRMQFGPKPSQA
jgi:thiamine biosynthesis lipoprotein ApbE